MKTIKIFALLMLLILPFLVAAQTSGTDAGSLLETGIAVGSVSMGVLELIKWLIRVFSKKPVAFPPVIYAVGVPVLNVLVTPGLALLGFEGFTMPTDWHGWALAAVRVLISSLISWGGYKLAIKPLKDYGKEYALAKSNKSVGEGP